MEELARQFVLGITGVYLVFFFSLWIPGRIIDAIWPRKKTKNVEGILEEIVEQPPL